MSLSSATPTTTVEAVNVLLRAIAEAPVSAVDGPSLLGSVASAVSMLQSVSEELQSKGRSFNTERGYPFSPDVNGEIRLPSNVISIDTDGRWKDTPVVQRGNRLYNLKDRSYTFAEPITCTVVWLFSYEDLPMYARALVVARAARMFQAQELGDPGQDAMLEQREYAAQIAFDRHEINNSDANGLLSQEALDAWARNRDPYLVPTTY